VSKKWTMPIRDWKVALNQFIILFEDRVPVWHEPAIYTVRLTTPENPFESLDISKNHPEIVKSLEERLTEEHTPSPHWPDVRCQTIWECLTHLLEILFCRLLLQFSLQIIW
jgi:hypothetical protein